MASEIAEKVHSPLPWREGYFGIVAADGKIVVEDGFLRDVNTELIVKAVNNHQRLLDALKAARQQIINMARLTEQRANWAWDLTDPMVEVDAAIAAVEGREL